MRSGRCASARSIASSTDSSSAGGEERLLGGIGDLDRRSGAETDRLEECHARVVLAGEGVLEVVGRPRGLLLRLEHLGERREPVLFACPGGVLEAVRGGDGSTGGGDPCRGSRSMHGTGA